MNTTPTNPENNDPENPPRSLTIMRGGYAIGLNGNLRSNIAFSYSPKQLSFYNDNWKVNPHVTISGFSEKQSAFNSTHNTYVQRKSSSLGFGVGASATYTDNKFKFTALTNTTIGFSTLDRFTTNEDGIRPEDSRTLSNYSLINADIYGSANIAFNKKGWGVKADALISANHTPIGKKNSGDMPPLDSTQFSFMGTKEVKSENGGSFQIEFGANFTPSAPQKVLPTVGMTVKF